MPGESRGFARKVLTKSDERRLARDVMEELVARGVSRPDAQRFVDRALAASESPSWIPHEPLPSVGPSNDSASLTDYLRNPDAVAQSQAHKDLTRGALAITGGIVLTWLSFATPGPGRWWYGLIVFGLFLFGRGIVRCAKLAGAFPWRTVLTNAAIPCAVLAAVLGWDEVHGARQARAAAAAELAAADQARAEQIRAESNAERNIGNTERTARLDARVARAVTQLSSKQPMTQCDAAILLGRLGAREQVPQLV